ncbi:hypothetical protein BJ508DRAFT_120970 [Ascobolus immersus RN42]|uniref:MYND-type domain-containing protein n=1 Tax=Ascobolus immersus RN42 TaxID=1160509 RepID=A0A3N4IL26_ASCIM|nr:hypothetical protein BJ508DRAFT_120970 [Ascobolus immersus RN42]
MAATPQSDASQFLLRDSTLFPSFDNIDDRYTYYPKFEYGDDFDSYNEEVEEWQEKYEYHTEFVGEIKEVDNLLRLVVKAVDRSGKRVMIAFYDSNRGGVYEERCKVGHTIMIQYPKPHHFMDGSAGFRIEDEDIDAVTVIPHSYERLLAANDAYFKITGNPDTCANCFASAADVKCKTGNALSSCARCKIAKYCNRECQMADWNNGHKLACRALPDIERIEKGPEQDNLNELEELAREG